MTLAILNPLAISMLVTFISMLLLIGGQYKIFPKRTGSRNNLLQDSDRGNLQLSTCCNENMAEEKKCPKRLNDFSGGTFGI